MYVYSLGNKEVTWFSFIIFTSLVFSFKAMLIYEAQQHQVYSYSIVNLMPLEKGSEMFWGL